MRIDSGCLGDLFGVVIRVLAEKGVVGQCVLNGKGYGGNCKITNAKKPCCQQYTPDVRIKVKSPGTNRCLYILI